MATDRGYTLVIDRSFVGVGEGGIENCEGCMPKEKQGDKLYKTDSQKCNRGAVTIKLS